MVGGQVNPAISVIIDNNNNDNNNNKIFLKFYYQHRQLENLWFRYLRGITWDIYIEIKLDLYLLPWISYTVFHKTKWKSQTRSPTRYHNHCHHHHYCHYYFRTKMFFKTLHITSLCHDDHYYECCGNFEYAGTYMKRYHFDKYTKPVLDLDIFKGYVLCTAEHCSLRSRKPKLYGNI